MEISSLIFYEKRQPLSHKRLKVRLRSKNLVCCVGIRGAIHFCVQKFLSGLVYLYYIFPLISLYSMADTAFVTTPTVGQGLLRSPIQNVTLCALVMAWVAVEAASGMQYMIQLQQIYHV